MKKKEKKSKIGGIIVGVFAIAIGLFIFYLVYSNYQDMNTLYNQATKVEGSVFNVQHLYDDMYRFEYRYFVGRDEYKAYVSEMEFADGLKDKDSIDVYYKTDDPTKVLLSPPTKTYLYIAIAFLITFVLLGLINIIKSIKK